MRTFSEFEKRIITQLVRTKITDSNILSFIANSVLENRGIKIIESERTIKFIYKLTDTETPTEIFETIALFKYLESNYLIFKHTNTITPYIGDFVTKNITQQTINEQVSEFREFPIPTNIFDIIQDYKTSYMIVGTELKILVQNNFKTFEDIKHQSQMRIANISLGIAFIALLFSFLSPFLFDTKIEQKQLDNITMEIKESNKEIIRQLEQIKNQINLETSKKSDKLSEKTVQADK